MQKTSSDKRLYSFVVLFFSFFIVSCKDSAPVESESMAKSSTPSVITNFFQNFERILKTEGPKSRGGYVQYDLGGWDPSGYGLDCSSSIVYALRKTKDQRGRPLLPSNFTKAARMDKQHAYFKSCGGEIKPGDFLVLGGAACLQNDELGSHWVIVSKTKQGADWSKIKASNWEYFVDEVMEQSTHGFRKHKNVPSYLSSMYMCTCTRLRQFDAEWKQATSPSQKTEIDNEESKKGVLTAKPNQSSYFKEDRDQQVSNNTSYNKGKCLINADTKIIFEYFPGRSNQKYLYGRLLETYQGSRDEKNNFCKEGALGYIFRDHFTLSDYEEETAERAIIPVPPPGEGESPTQQGEESSPPSGSVVHHPTLPLRATFNKDVIARQDPAIMQYVKERFDSVAVYLQKEKQDPTNFKNVFIAGSPLEIPDLANPGKKISACANSKCSLYFVDGQDKAVGVKGVQMLLPVLDSLASRLVDLTPVKFREWDGRISTRVLLPMNSTGTSTGSTSVEVYGNACQRKDQNNNILDLITHPSGNAGCKATQSDDSLYWLWIDCSTHKFRVIDSKGSRDVRCGAPKTEAIFLP